MFCLASKQAQLVRPTWNILQVILFLDLVNVVVLSLLSLSLIAYGKDLALQNLGGTEGSKWMLTFTSFKVPSSSLNTSLKESNNWESLSSILRMV